MLSTIWKWIESPTLTKKQAIIGGGFLTISFLVTFACVLYFAVTIKDDASPAPIGTLSATQDPRYPGSITSFFCVDKFSLTATEQGAGGALQIGHRAESRGFAR